MKIARQLFKLVAVRPPERPDKEARELRFLRPPGGGAPSTALQRDLEAAADLAAARQRAEEHVLSDLYVQSAQAEDDPLLHVLSQAYAEALSLARQGDVERIRAFLGDLEDLRPSGGGPDEVAALERRLWDSLIAAFLVPRVRPHDRADQVGPLRMLHLLRNGARIESARGFREALAATPLIPSWIARRSAPEGTGADGPSPAGPVGPVDGVPGPAGELGDQLADVERVLADLDRAYLETSRALERERQPPRVVEAPEPTADRRLPAARVDRSQPPWRTADEVAERLAPSSVELLEAFDPAWRLRGLDEVRTSVERRSAELERALSRVDATVPNRAPTEGPLPGLQAVDPFGKSITGSVGSVRPVGVGDLLVVEETLLRYEEAEVAHVENVMLTETRERVHRRLDREVETIVTSSEQSEETERDLQSSERFELATEVEETLSRELSTSAGLNISASYGPVLSTEASADFAVNSSSESSMSSATGFVQEVVDKSVSKVSQKIKEQITRKTLSEIEETNTHGFDNTAGSGHVIGVYRWIDQVWQAQVKNYGRRLMMEFIVPEPAAFFKHARQGQVANGVTMTPPEPLPADFGFRDVKAGNYETWVDRYRVPDVSPPPAQYVLVSKLVELPELMHAPESNDYVLMTRSDSVAIPAGYLAKEAWVYGSWQVWDSAVDKLHVHVGRRIFDKDENISDTYKTLDDEVDQVAVGVYAYEIVAATISIEVRCKRSEELLREWQLETWRKVVDAFEAQQAAYDAHVASIENASLGTFDGLHPDTKREIEQVELRRGALVLLTDQHFVDFDAMTAGASAEGYPEIDVDEAMEEGPYVQFFEQLFEWEQMTYLFYPYFWGRKGEWLSNALASDSDPLFQAFLKAGAARVQLPVRPGYEKALAFYLEYGEIWNGGEVPVVDSELFVAIVDEITEAYGAATAGAVDEGEPIEFTLPTALVLLQEGPELPSWEEGT